MRVASTHVPIVKKAPGDVLQRRRKPTGPPKTFLKVLPHRALEKRTFFRRVGVGKHPRLKSRELKERAQKHPGLQLCCDQTPSICVSSQALFKLETCRVARPLARGYIFHALHWFLFSCPCGRPRAGARARAVRPGARRPPTQATPCLRKSQVTNGSPTA